MATAQMNGFLRQLTRGMAAERLAEETDRQLVERLLAGPDEAAFEALVRRHGPMVYRVCWRALHQAEDTEDAFQATFLALARKLPTVRKRESLASWLHGVAHRLALTARKQAARRRRHEANVPAPGGPPDEITWRELRAVLDAELAGLPERLRLPLILCYLEGLSQEEAARQLGWSKSTLLRRLEEARVALGRRLARKGFAWAAALSAVLLSDSVAPASLAPEFIRSTAEAAACALTEGTAGGISSEVVSLAEGVRKAMFTSNSRLVFPALVLVAALISGALGLLTEALSGGGGPPALAAAQPPQEKPKPEADKGPGKIAPTPPIGLAVPARKPVVVREDAQVQNVAWSADGKAVATITQSYDVVEVKDSAGENPMNVLVPRSTVKIWDAKTGKLVKSLVEEKHTHLGAFVFSPDGKRAAIMGSGIALKRDEAKRGPFVKVLDAKTWAVQQELSGADLQGVGSVLVFSPDGKTLALGGGSPFAEKGSVVKLWDVERKKMTTAVKFAAPARDKEAKPRLGDRPPDFWMVVSLAFSPDGKLLAAGEFGRGGRRARAQLYDARTGEPKRAWEIGESKGMVDVAFTAEGKRLLSASGAVKLWDVSTGKELTTLETKEEPLFRIGPPSPTPSTLLEMKGLETFRVAVSPDGWHIATSGIRKVKGKSIREVNVWSAKSGGNLRTVLWDNPALWASSIAFSRDGKTLAVGAQTDADVRAKGSEKVKGELRLIRLGE